MIRHSRRTRLLVGAVLATLLTLTVSACSTGTVGGSSTPASTASGSASGDSAEALQAAYDGVVGAPPTETVPVTPGLTAWVSSCGELSLTCSVPAQAAVEAAETVGWQASVCDGKLNPDGWGNCIRQGVAAKADVIITIGQDCAAMSGAMQEAKAAGITTVNVGGQDCEDSLYSATVQLLDGYSYDQYWEEVGTLQADWLIGKTDGAAKLLQVEFNDTQWGPLVNKGLTERLAECSGCSIAGTVQLSNSDLATGQLPQKFSTALLQASDANAVAVPIDGWFLAGLAQAIKASGKSDDLNVIGNFGSVPTWDVISSDGGQDATVATSQEWQGWAGVDAALRVLADQEVLPAGVGLQVVDADTNLPAAGEQFTFTPPIDFRAGYEAVWEK
ncbi:substrate-binding domain-containing protein [Microbacterium sp. LWH7-1.2]|uniref:sugar ABC transporter substrate-binding protein n=1 Tax=Microbacterium sp. LWH7-1.2 TaxID=3135257 RepID=UPI003138A1DF